MKHIVIAGGTGLVGSRLTELLLSKGYRVTILTRNINKQSTHKNLNYALWNTNDRTIDSSVFETANAIVNLAGEGVVNKRWNKKQKQLIIDSRVNSCQTIVKALHQNKNIVATVINASAIGWYKSQENYVNSTGDFQENQEPNTDFLGTACRLWEESISPVQKFDKRLVILRIGIVFSKKGGAIPEFLKPIKMGIAAILGNQKISWIHIDDLCNLIIDSIENTKYIGAYNAVSSHTTTNKELNLALAKKLKGKWFLPVAVPQFLIKLLLGEMSVEVLKSSEISNKKLLNIGFNYKYNSLSKAIDELCS